MSSVDLYPVINWIDGIVEKINTECVDKAMPDYMESAKGKLEEKYRLAIKQFYDDYDPKYYERTESLYELLTINLVGSGRNAGLDMNINEDIEKPSWHYAHLSSDNSLVQIGGYPEPIYKSVFEQGYHGGRGGTHSLWGWGTATPTKPPDELFDKGIQEYCDNEAENDFIPIFEKYFNQLNV